MIVSTRKIINLIRAYPPWLWESRFFWLTTLVAAGVPVACWALWPGEFGIRLAGLLLQLAGIGLVWLGIRETRKHFEHPSFWMQAWEWFRRRPKYRGRDAILGVDTGALTVTGQPVFFWLGAAPDVTLERRVEILEKNLISVKDRLEGFQQKAEDDIRRHDQAIREEQRARDGADQEIRDKMKATETGGLHISAMGALWLLEGVTMGTIPTEIAGWINTWWPRLW